jgi:Na+/H+ antiporter NhaD/arsenite permease-like protein
VVLIAPVTILIGEILGMSPVPLLMAEALLSNTGGVATLVGDPPNVLIGSAAGLTFNDFITHSLPIVVVIWLVVLLLLRYLFKRELAIQPQDIEAVRTLEPREALNDPVAARKVLIVLVVAVIFFFLEDVTHLSTSYIAMAGSAVALLWVSPDINETLKRVEWSVLVFFAALFVMVGGLENAGVLHRLAEMITQGQHISPVWFGVIMIWVVAGLSAVVDNVPITIALIPVILDLGQAGMNITPLWWALAFGAGFGGNGTIIGSTANIVVATLSERTNEPITSAMWSKRGLPAMLAACAVASLLYLLAYPYLSR